MHSEEEWNRAQTIVQLGPVLGTNVGKGLRIYNSLVAFNLHRSAPSPSLGPSLGVSRSLALSEFGIIPASQALPLQERVCTTQNA